MVKNSTLEKKSYKIVVGIDEAGRGPLAGPVVAAAISISSRSRRNVNELIGKGTNQCFDVQRQNIRDSKKMTARQREQVYNFLKAHPSVEWGVGRVGERVIDKINILEASKLAMARAVRNLEKKIGYPAEFLLIDGNFTINLPHKQESIIKGDEKVFLIKLASIIAKVSRDNAMLRYHRKYPDYGFNRHKGYPTKLHKEMLEKHGACQLHRKTFKPVQNLENINKICYS